MNQKNFATAWIIGMILFALSGFTAGTTGLFFLPILVWVGMAVLMIVAVRKGIGVRRCSACNEILRTHGDFCPKCGSQQEHSSNVSVAPRKSNKVECQYCGHMNKPGRQFCSKCNGLL